VLEILLTNDDGADSRALVPFAAALAELGSVRVVVPDRERSWVGKAITRFDDLEVQVRDGGGVEIFAVSGYPADCVQLGVFNLFDGRPDLVVSGINVGANHGEAYVLGSGTVGAAMEAAIVGVPAMAFSAVSTGEWGTWSAWAKTAESDEMWARLAAVAVAIIRDVLEVGHPAEVDVLKVELPADAGPATARRATPAAPVRYGRLFERKGENRYHHRYTGGLHPVGPVDSTDMTVVRGGEIAVTALRLARSVPVPEPVRARLEG
jgi:5'-nucleotidase